MSDSVEPKSESSNPLPKSNPISPSEPKKASSPVLGSSVKSPVNKPRFTSDLTSLSTSTPTLPYFFTSLFIFLRVALIFTFSPSVEPSKNWFLKLKASGYRSLATFPPRCATDLATFLKYPFTPLGFTSLSLPDKSSGKSSSLPPKSNEKSSLLEVVGFCIIFKPLNLVYNDVKE